MKKHFIMMMITLFSVSVVAQQREDFANYRKLADYQVAELKEGALVLRLILNKKNAELYRKAGNEKLADKLEKDLKERNGVLANVFLDSSFDFCKVYIIEASDYKKLLSGEKSGYFLNQKLEVDPTISLHTDKFYFMDIGSVYEAQTEKVDGEIKTAYAASAVAQDALVIKDKEFNQLLSPFPFYVKLSGLNANIKDLTFNINPNDKNYLKYSNTNNYKKYIAEKYDLKRSELSLATKAYYLNKQLSRFYNKRN